MRTLKILIARLAGYTRKYRALFVWALISLAVVSAMIVVGSAGGYRVAVIEKQEAHASSAVQSLEEQYSLAQQDLQAGKYDFARQRFEYILTLDPAFPGAADGLAEAIAILYATVTPTPVPPTATATPTPDLRPIEQQYSELLSFFDLGEWDAVIDIVLAIRRADSMYRTVDIDRLLYRALRQRGVVKIQEKGDLEGGIYDLTLTERFGPLDRESLALRDLARYYMMGSGFWEVFPEQAVYYFGLVSAAAPYMTDGSGWTAAARLQAALVQLGDQLAKQGDWCSAQQQYELAISYGGGGDVQAAAENAAFECSPPTETALPETETPTITSTPTLTLVFPLTPTTTQLPSATTTPTPPTVIPPTDPVSPTPSSTSEISPTPSPTPEPSALPSPTATSTSPSTDTPEPTATIEILPTDTPVPSSTGAIP